MWSFFCSFWFFGSVWMRKKWGNDSVLLILPNGLLSQWDSLIPCLHCVKQYPFHLGVNPIRGRGTIDLSSPTTSVNFHVIRLFFHPLLRTHTNTKKKDNLICDKKKRPQNLKYIKYILFHPHFFFYLSLQPNSNTPNPCFYYLYNFSCSLQIYSTIEHYIMLLDMMIWFINRISYKGYILQ